MGCTVNNFFSQYLCILLLLWSGISPIKTMPRRQHQPAHSRQDINGIPVWRIRSILIRIRIPIQAKMKRIQIRIQAKKGFSTRKISKKLFRQRSFLMFCALILLKFHFSINNHLNLVTKNKISFLIFCFQCFLLDPDPYNLMRIRIPAQAQLLIRIQGNVTDPDPGKCYGSGGSATLLDTQTVSRTILSRTK